MNRKIAFPALGLLLCLLLLPGLAAADATTTDTPAAAPTYLDPSEPNDTLDTAAPAYSYHQTGYFLSPGDVDFYRYTLPTPDEAYASVWIDGGYASPPAPGAEIALLNAAGAVVAEDTSCVPGADVRANLPAGTYYVRLRPCAGMHDIDADYQLTSYGAIPYPTPLTDAEPNDTPETAVPVIMGQTIFGNYDGFADDEAWECKSDDWYVFQGRAGDVFDFVDRDEHLDSPLAWLYDADLVRLEWKAVLPSDGTYYLRVLTEWWSDDDAWCQDGPYSFTLGESIWVSAAADGLGGNAAIRRGDIATRLTRSGKWTLVFDASDVGVTGNVVAFERMPNGTILMSLAAAQFVPGLGRVMPQDIIRFIPTSLGPTTAGTFEWFLDGSDVGLTTTGERIDAIYMKPIVENPLHISITGAGRVPRRSGGILRVADEDLINLVQTRFGADSAGSWRMNIDGSTLGWAAEDLNAYDCVRISNTYCGVQLLTFTDNYTYHGITYTNRDVHGVVRRLTDRKIDGLAVGPAWTP